MLWCLVPFGALFLYTVHWNSVRERNEFLKIHWHQTWVLLSSIHFKYLEGLSQAQVWAGDHGAGRIGMGLCGHWGLLHRTDACAPGGVDWRVDFKSNTKISLPPSWAHFAGLYF